MATASNPVFNLGRTLTLSFVTLFAFAWVILLSIVAFAWWTLLSVLERSFVGIFVFTNMLTVIGLPVLIIHDFRPWLDAARMLFFIMAHLGSAIGFAVWQPQFTCSNREFMTTCVAINDYILAFSWVIPTLLLLYAACLGVFCWRQRSAQEPANQKFMSLDDGDIEKAGAVPLSDAAINDRMRSLTLPTQGATKPTPIDINPAVRPEWDRLPRLSITPTPTRSHVSVPPTPRTPIPRVSLPPLPPHMSWASPNSPGAYSGFTEFNTYYSAPMPHISSPTTLGPSPYYAQSRKSLPPIRRMNNNVPVPNPTDRMSRLSSLIAERLQSDSLSDDSSTIYGGKPENKRKLVKSMSRGHAL